MTTTTNTAAHYRTTRTGEWVVCGSPSVVFAGATVTVRTKAGATKTERIVKVGTPFTADGTTLVYGYIGSGSAAKSSSSTGSAKTRIHRCGEPITAADIRFGVCSGCNVRI